jgi:hypothetical protein
MAPLLVYLYGPPASGKLTIAEQLVERTGFRLFHNHLTVNAVAPVFPFGTDAFSEVLHRLRLDVFATAARHGIDLIFTNNSAWSGVSGRADFVAFAERVESAVRENGGRTVFVQIAAPQLVLEERVSGSSRVGHGKLVDVQRLRELLRTHDPSPLHATDLRVDSSKVSPTEAAARIAAAIDERRAN